MGIYDIVGLYEHNACTYDKVKKGFEENNIVGIVQATGTGKTYIGIQLVYDNKNLKSVWLVPSNSIAEHIIRTIDDNPNLDMNRDFSNLQIMTYQSLVNMSTEELANIDVDLLILDEFHHIGAPIWGERVNTIINNHPNLKVFGMTAYTVRHRGTSYEKDMALEDGNELFSNRIVSRYDLCDAIIDAVLPKPIYKSAYTKLIELANDLVKRVSRMDITTRDYKEYIMILNSVKKRIQDATSMSEIIKANLKPNGKYIYFCPPSSEEGVNDIETIKREAIEWFKKIVPETEIIIYTSTSDMTDNGKSNRYAFYNDTDLGGNKVNNKLRVMFAINQYNEGVHAPNIDGVIMGRGTSSDIIFFEQLGRALSVRGNTKKMYDEYNKHSIETLRILCINRNIRINDDMSKEKLIEKLIAPIIIDLTGNIDFIIELENSLKNGLKEIQSNGTGTRTISKISDASFDLDLIEVDLFNILEKLKDKIRMTWEDYYKLAQEYYEEYGDLEIPARYKTKSGIKLGSWIYYQKTTIHPESEKGKKLQEIGMCFDVRKKLSWEEMYEYARLYYQYHGNLRVLLSFKTKNGYEYDEEGVCLGSWISTQRRAYKNITKKERINTFKPLTPKQVELLESIGMIWNVQQEESFRWEKIYEYATIYYQKHCNLEVPVGFKTTNGYEYDEYGKINLGTWIRTQRKFENPTSEKGKLLAKIGMRFESKYNILSWEEMYEYAKLYYQYYGNLRVPPQFKTTNGYEFDEDGKISLGNWILRQRKAYKCINYQQTTKTKPLTPKQIELLENIGMIWSTRNNRMEIEKLCNEYSINIKLNSDILCNISIIEFKLKILFLIDNNMTLTTNGKLNELFSMSSENMKLNYGVTLEDLFNIYKKGKKKCF